MTTKTITTPKSKVKYLSQVITVDNVMQLGEQTARKAIATVAAKSQNKFAQEMLVTLTKDILANKKDVSHQLSNAYDLAQTASCFYCGYMGKRLCDITTNGEISYRTKEPLDIYKACMQVLNRLLYQGKVEFQNVYLLDIDVEEQPQPKLVPVPVNWDMPTITDLKGVLQAIDNMGLSPREHQVVNYRLQGLGYKKIANIMGTYKGTIQEYLKRVQAKAIKIGIVPKRIKNKLA